MLIGIAAHWSIVSYIPQSGKEAVYSEEHQKIAGSLILAYLLDFMQTLLTVGLEQMREGQAISESVTSGGSNALAGFITAPFRRMLPAIHIASRWTRMHADLLSEASMDAQNKLGNESSTLLSLSLNGFYSVFAEFSSLVITMFPIEQLPSEDVALEEDVEVRGFLPFQKDQRGRPGVSPTWNKRDLSNVHPNDEHLMRIRDLQRDAQFLTAAEVRCD